MANYDTGIVLLGVRRGVATWEERSRAQDLSETVREQTERKSGL